MAKRKAISQKTRFEIFKRDSFTCQYCGKKAPDVILNVDHIHPVKLGGENDILNLITSCFDCNSGKKAIPLGDNSTLVKQQKQLEELNERRLQIEMLLQWRNGLANLTNMEVDNYADYINKYTPGFSVTDSFKLEIKKWVKKYTPELIYECIDEAAQRYLKFTNNNLEPDSAQNYVGKIRGILYFKSLPPLKQKINWIKVILKKEFSTSAWDVDALLDEYVAALRSKKWTEEEIIDDLQDEVRKAINSVYSYSQFVDKIEGWIESIKKWE